MIKIEFKQKSLLQEARGNKEVKEFFKTNFVKIIKFCEKCQQKIETVPDNVRAKKYEEESIPYSVLEPLYFQINETDKNGKIIVIISYFMDTKESRKLPRGAFQKISSEGIYPTIFVNIKEKNLVFKGVPKKITGISKEILFKDLYETLLHEFVHSIQYDDKTVDNFYKQPQMDDAPERQKAMASATAKYISFMKRQQMYRPEMLFKIVGNEKIRYYISPQEVQAFVKQSLFHYKKSDREKTYKDFLYEFLLYNFGGTIMDELKDRDLARVSLRSILDLYYDFYLKNLATGIPSFRRKQELQ